PPGADVYTIAMLISDWDDPEATAILRRCAEAGGPSARVLIIEGALPEEDPAMSSAMDLLMLVLVGGRSRTAAQFRILRAAAGLELVKQHPAPSGRCVLECAVRR